MERDEIVQRLKECAGLKTGDPMPPWMSVNSWGVEMARLCAAAVDHIESIEGQLEAALYSHHITG